MIIINSGINLFERRFKEVDYETLIGYCRKHRLSEDYAIIVDFNKPSGLHRFFVCDLKKHTIVASSLCTHGAGGRSTANRPGILIHSAKLISKFRWGIFPFYLPMDKRISSGCFAVDIDMMKTVEGILKKGRSPILVYAFQ